MCLKDMVSSLDIKNVRYQTENPRFYVRGSTNNTNTGLAKLSKFVIRPV
jgi:hypothetical protein